MKVYSGKEESVMTNIHWFMMPIKEDINNIYKERLDEIKEIQNYDAPVDENNINEIFKYVAERYALQYNADDDEYNLMNPRQKTNWKSRQLPTQYENKALTWRLIQLLYYNEKMNIILENETIKLINKNSLLNKEIRKLREDNMMIEIKKLKEELKKERKEKYKYKDQVDYLRNEWTYNKNCKYKKELEYYIDEIDNLD